MVRTTVLAAMLGGCGANYGVTAVGTIDPAAWEALGDEPAILFGRTDGGPIAQPYEVLCPGDTEIAPFDVRIGGCTNELELELWLVPDSAIPEGAYVHEVEPPSAELACDPDRRTSTIEDPTFTSEGWPGAVILAFEGETGSLGTFSGGCMGWTEATFEIR